MKTKCTVTSIIVLLFTSFQFQVSAAHNGLMSKDTSSSTPLLIDKEFRYQPVQFKIGFDIGVELPYNVEYSLLFNELVDISGGIGIGLSGFKYGMGLRVFPIRKRKISPMLGIFYYHASGLNSLNVNVNNDYATYKITPDNAILCNSGIRFRFGKGHYLLFNVGYSFPFKGDKAVYIDGSKNESVKTLANSVATGGFSVNIGILFKISKGYFIVRKETQ